jgi:hypothetical protein
MGGETTFSLYSQVGRVKNFNSENKFEYFQQLLFRGYPYNPIIQSNISRQSCSDDLPFKTLIFAKKYEEQVTIVTRQKSERERDRKTLGFL